MRFAGSASASETVKRIGRSSPPELSRLRKTFSRMLKLRSSSSSSHDGAKPSSLPRSRLRGRPYPSACRPGEKYRRAVAGDRPSAWDASRTS